MPAEWPARLQRLKGALARSLPEGFDLWLDGGHNAGAGVALAQHLATWRDRPLHLVVGMKKGKATEDFLRPLVPLATTLTAVAERPGLCWYAPAAPKTIGLSAPAAKLLRSLAPASATTTEDRRRS